MDSSLNVTSASPQQSEPDQDTSSLQNLSTNPAEAGTTDEMRDDDPETSSIEALNWSEVEEEELAAAQKAEALASAIASGLSLSQAQVKLEEDDAHAKAIAAEKDDESQKTKEGSSNGNSTVLLNDEQSNVLSTSMLQSRNSKAADEDRRARKQSVIENWVEGVTSAVKLEDDFPDDTDHGGDDEEDTEENRVRKRKGKRLTPDMVSSVMSTASQGESSVDPLSNAPVLDDGPIWNRGPRSYTFQENRGINQKLTFCVTIAVVLAIGLGLGNLVAHQECEAEFKASQQSQVNKVNIEKSPIHAGTIPTTTTPSPIIPDRSTSTDSTLPSKPYTPPKKIEEDEDVEDEKVTIPEHKIPKLPGRDDPIIDPKYRVHAETLSKVVHVLDRLSQKIDQFENNTRKLQGVLMIPDEDVEEKPKRNLFDERIHHDDGNLEKEIAIDDVDEEDEEEKEAEEEMLNELIDAIEQTPDYVEMKEAEENLRDLENYRNEKSEKKETEEPTTPEEKERVNSFRFIEKTFKQIQEFKRRFIQSERKRLREAGKFHRFKWRLPEEYTVEEKNVLRARYKESWNKFLDLSKEDVPDPVHVLFGNEDGDEKEQERTYADVFYYPFEDLDDMEASKERDLEFEEKLRKSGFFERIKRKREYDNFMDIDLDFELPGSNPIPSPSTSAESDGETTLEEEVQPQQHEPQVISDLPSNQWVPSSIPELTDDLIVLEEVKPKETKGEEVLLEEQRNTFQYEYQPPSPPRKENVKAPQTEVPQIPSGKSERNSDSGRVAVDVDINSVRSQNQNQSPPPKLESDTATNNPSTATKTSEKAPIENSSPSPVKVKREVKDSSKPFKKQGQGSNSNEKSQSQSESVGRTGKREQKQKEQKVRQGKQKTNAKLSNNNNNESPGKNEKIAKKANKQNNNKVFENVKGPNVNKNEKRRGSSPPQQSQSGKEGSSHSHSVVNEKQQRNNKNSHGQGQGQRNSGEQNQNSKPIKDHRKRAATPPQSQEKPNSRAKHESQELPATNNNNRRKREFNGNYGNGNKKSNWQKDTGKSKERGRERATPVGN